MNRRKIGKPVEPRSIQNQNYNQTYLHHKTCQELFQKAESDETLWVRFEEIIYTDEMGKSNFYEEEMKTIEVSIITQSIMDYDRRMFSNMMEFTNNILDDSYYYRPYFLSFLISVDEVKENNYSMSFLRNEENLHQWFRAGFSDLNSDKDVLEFPGWFQTAASPIIYKRKTLFVEDKYLSPKVVEEINTLYDLGNNYCSTDKKIENMLATQFPSGYFHEARIYSVGNGNCVYLHGKNGSKKMRLLFDIEFHVGATPPRQLKVNKTKKAISAIRNFRPDCIVLSHWDSDHYMGCAYARYRIFNCTWVAPDCYDASPNARRLAKYLQIKKKLLVVTRGKSRIKKD